MDFGIEHHGSICLLFPESRTADEWIEENVGEHQTWAGTVVVEPRYIDDLVAGMLDAGLEMD